MQSHEYSVVLQVLCTDASKSGKVGAKRSLLTDGRGEPLSIAVDGANTNDHLLLEITLDCIPVPRPTNATENLCLDKDMTTHACQASSMRVDTSAVTSREVV